MVGEVFAGDEGGLGDGEGVGGRDLGRGTIRAELDLHPLVFHPGDLIRRDGCAYPLCDIDIIGHKYKKTPARVP